MVRKQRIFSVSSPAADQLETTHSQPFLSKFAASFTPIICLSAISHNQIVSGGDCAIVWNVEKQVEELVLRNKFNNAFVSVCATVKQDYILTANQNESTVNIYNFTNGELVKQLDDHEDQVNDVVVTPDDKYIVSGSSDRRILIWTLLPGKIFSTVPFELLWNLQGHSGAVTTVLVTPKITHIVSGSADKQLRVWDFHSGECVQTLTGHTFGIDKVLTTSANDKLVSSAGNQIKIFDFSLSTCVKTIITKTSVKGGLALSTDNKLIYAGNYFGGIEIFEMITGVVVRNLTFHNSIAVKCLLMSEEGKLVSSDNRGNLFLFDCNTGKKNYNAHLRGHDHVINNLYATKRSHHVISVSKDALIKIWDVSSETKPSTELLTLDNDGVAINLVTCSDDEEMIITSDVNNQIKFWKFSLNTTTTSTQRTRTGSVIDVVTNPNLLHFIQIPKPQTITSIISLDSGYCIYSVSSSIKVVDVNTFEEVQEITPEDTYDSDDDIAEQNDSSVPDSGFRARARSESRKNREISAVYVGEETTSSLSTANCDGVFLSGTSHGMVYVFEFQKNEFKIATRITHNEPIKLIKCSSNKRLSDAFVVVVDVKNCVKLYTLSSGEMLRELQVEPNNSIRSLCFSGDNRFVVLAGGEDKVVKIFDAKEGVLVRVLEGHAKEIKTVCLTKSGEVCSGGKDKSLFVWNLDKFLLNLPFLVDLDFKSDLAAANKSEVAFGWPRISRVLEQCRMAVAEQRVDDGSYLNLAMRACMEGRDDLMVKMLSGGGDVAFASILVEDSEGKNCLDYAMAKRAGGCVREIFLCYEKLLEADFGVGSVTSNHEVHLTDLIDVERLCTALARFPEITVSFLTRGLMLLPAYEHIVKKNCNLFQLEEEDQIVLGSEIRNPVNFWQKYLYPVAKRKKKDSFNSSGSAGENSSVFEGTEVERSEVETENSARVPGGWSVNVNNVRRRSRSLRGGKVTVVGPHLLMRKKFGSLINVSNSNSDFSASNVQKGEPVSAFLVPIKNAVNSDFLTSIVKACEKVQKFELCENEVVASIIQYYWESRVEPRFMYNLYVYLVFVLALSIDSVTHRVAVNWKDEASARYFVAFYAPPIVVLFLWGYFLKHEIMQLKATRFMLDENEKKKRFLFKKHFFGLGVWNAMDCITLVLILCVYVGRYVEFFYFGDTKFMASSLILSVALPCGYLNGLYYMQGFEKSGKLVCMIVGIIRGVGVFLLILLVIIVGYALAFSVLYRMNEDNKDSSNNILMRSFESYVLMLTNESDTIALNEGHWAIVGVSVILFITFTLLVNIVLLNLLIALMGAIFDRIQESARAQFLFAKARIILEFESILRPVSEIEVYGRQRKSGQRKSGVEKNDLVKGPVWLQVLVPTSTITTRGKRRDEGGGAVEEWGGKLRGLKKSQVGLIQTVADLRNDVKSEVGDMKENLVTIRGLLEAFAAKEKNI